MSAQSIAHQKRRISRGISGLLLVSVITFTSILVVIQSQYNEINQLEKRASHYHLLISQKALELLGAIDESKMWFRDLELERHGLSAAQGNTSSLPSLRARVSVRDRTSALNYEIKKLVTEIETIQAQYAVPGFDAISSTLKSMHIKVQADLGKLLSAKTISYRKVDDIVDPLIPVMHQLQRLHQHAYRDMSATLDNFHRDKRIQFIGLIVSLTVLGLFLSVVMLRNLHRAFADLVIAQNYLQESEHFNRMLFEQSSMGLMLCHMNGELVDINHACARIIGHTIEEARHLTYWDITPQTYMAEEQAQLENLNNTGCYGPYEKEYIHKDGHLVPVRLQGSLVEKDGETLIWSSIEDITTRKLNEAELDKYRNHLEELVRERTRKLEDAQDELVRKERLATLGQLTATVSHELRNPLGAMRPSLYVIEKKSDKNDERVQKAIKWVDRNIDRCDRIIDELLDFTRITELDRCRVRIDEWLDSVIDEQHIPNNIQVEKNLTLNDVELTIDADRLRRAVINVVENACHAMLEDERPPEARKGSRLGIKTGGNDRRIEITIIDTGSGIEKDIQRKIFEPLFSTKSFGVGLGMPAVKQIMQQHGGGIEIESEAGHGTQVTLWLPADAAGLDDEEVAA